MLILIMLLLCLAIVAAVVGMLRQKNLEKQLEEGKIDKIPEVVEADDECCGQHEMCERDSLLAGVSKDVEYYDDEELDRYIGVSAEDYTEEQEEEFRDILYTMHEEDVAGWIRSLTLRRIELPLAVRDEVLLVASERRIH